MAREEVKTAVKSAAARRGAGRPPKEWLDSLRDFTSKDASILVMQCVNVIINTPKDEAKVRIKVPFNHRKTSKKLPRGRTVDAEIYAKTIEFSADAILDYMHAQGYSAFSAAELRTATKAFSAALITFDRVSAYALESEALRALEEALTETNTKKNSNNDLSR